MSKYKNTDPTKLLNTLPITPISDLKAGTLYKINGIAETESSMLSLLTKSKCIGYTFYEKKWVSRKPFKNSHSDKKWKTLSSQTECRDFYIKDKSGKIKVNAYDIKIHLNINESKKNNKGTYLIENILLADNTNYIVLGTVSNGDNNSLEICKSLDGAPLIIMDEKFYNIYVHKNPYLRVGCAVLLIAIAIAFFSVFVKSIFF
ncbi:hypothetical protein [Psychroserpens sp. NJDZ02]|uniref:hypothetical protein n=1 Tax=Psychroserpens sp. NJDZ02 TaxID=2570561 RepID=UPI0010A945E6|nr:hypothetical protein [Psychroserpens sp. NJDZ02]QCE43134.1 hypothetical protein E9099_17485 [Psychroserpens sp. NJDZ02]